MPDGVFTGLIYGAVLGAATVILISAMIWWKDDLRFHVRGFVFGLVGALAASPIIGAIAWFAQGSKSNGQ